MQMSSKYVDVAAITQIIGCVFNEPALLDETDKYIISEHDFPDEFHKIVFGSIHNIHMMGSALSVDVIIDYLANKQKFNAIFQANKGVEYLTEASSAARKDEFNYYYNRLKKFSLLRAYDNIGLDVSFLYDPINVLDVKKRQAQDDWLDAASLSAIAEAIDNKIEKIKSNYIDDDGSPGYQAGEGINELIEDLERHPEVGIPLYGQIINSITKGARLRKFYLRSAATGTGKAIPDYIHIPTPNGYKRVKDIRPGDYLFNRLGFPTKVLEVHPQSERKVVWEVEFEDGRIAKCCKDHLWEYICDSKTDKSFRVESAQDIYQRTKKLKNGYRNATNSSYRYFIRVAKPVQYDKRDYDIDPYFMGVCIGNGSFRFSGTNQDFVLAPVDIQLLDDMAEYLKCTCVENSKFKGFYIFKPKNEENPMALKIRDMFRSYPELWDIKSEYKIIPDDYLCGSLDQRYRLLQGLMDTNGQVLKKEGKIVFVTSSKSLKDNFLELCHSLGMVPTIEEQSYLNKNWYYVHMPCKDKKAAMSLFRLKKKQLLVNKYYLQPEPDENAHEGLLAITDIRKTSEKEPMTCFTVDNPEHLYLMNNYIVTHNTRSMIADACNFACNQIYHDQFGWIKNGTCQPTLFIATEQDRSEIQTMMLAFLSNVDEDHILRGQYLEGERDRVLKAAEIIKNSPIWVEELPDFSLQDVENKIKKNIRERDVKYVCSKVRAV